ncbi:MAG: DNA repair protein RecO [Candidatus Omnitrophota bacterium]
MSIQKTRGIILRRDELRETSLILTVYTRDFGKLKLVSKGARTPDQRFISAYELFALCDMVFYERKKKGFFLLSQCELVNFFSKIREDFDRLTYAAYLIELLGSSTGFGDKNQRLFELLLNSLELLSGNASPKRVARIFEIKMLSELGHMPRISLCVGCNADLDNTGCYRFSVSSGGVLCEKCFSKDRNAKQILQGTIRFMSRVEELPFEKAKQIKVAKSVGNEVEAILTNFIRYHLDIRLRSLSFIAKTGLKKG